MRVIRTRDGLELYSGYAVPQVDGGYRHLCATTQREARAIREAIMRDPSMVDGVKCITVDSRKP